MARTSNSSTREKPDARWFMMLASGGSLGLFEGGFFGAGAVLIDGRRREETDPVIDARQVNLDVTGEPLDFTQIAGRCGLTQRAQRSECFLTRLATVIDLAGKSGDHVVDIHDLFGEVVVLPDAGANGQVAARDRAENTPELVQRSRNTVRDDDRMGGEEHEDQEDSGPESMVEVEELRGRLLFLVPRSRFVGELHHRGEEQRSRQRDENDREIKKVERDESPLKAVQE